MGRAKPLRGSESVAALVFQRPLIDNGLSQLLHNLPHNESTGKEFSMHFSMTKSHGIRLLAGAALVAVLGGCLSGADESAEDRQARANGLKFIQESSAPISAKFSAEAPVPGSFVIRQNYTNPQHEIIVDNLKAIGCPNLA